MTATDERTAERVEAVDPGRELAVASDLSRGALAGMSLTGRLRYAKELADANLLPGQFRRRPADVFYAVEYATMLGIHPLAAITGIHVMDGKPTASAGLMGALVRNAGHRLRIKVEGTVEAGDLRATATIVRSDDPDYPFTATWTLQRAHRAGLIDSLTADQQGRTIIRARTNNGRPSQWEKFPEAMVKARAISEVTREACEEVLCGVKYTPEELGANVNEDGDVIEGELDPDPPQQQEQRPQYTEEQLDAAARDAATRVQAHAGNADTIATARTWAAERGLLERDVRPAIDRYKDAELRGRVLAAAGALEPGVAITLTALLTLLAEPASPAPETPASSDVPESPAPSTETPGEPPGSPDKAAGELAASGVPVDEPDAAREAVLALREALVSDDPVEVEAIYRSSSPEAREVDVASELDLVEVSCLRGTGRLGDDRRLGAVLYAASLHLRAGGKPLRDTIRDEPQPDADGIVDAELVESDGSAEDPFDAVVDEVGAGWDPDPANDPWAEQASKPVPPLP